MVDVCAEKYFQKLTEIVQEFAGKNQYEISEIDDGFVLDIPVEYEVFEDEEDIIDDLDSLETELPMDIEIPDNIKSKIEHRRQFVYVTGYHKGPDNEDMFQVFTVCAPDDERFYKSALLLNMNLPFGAIALSNVEGETYFVLVDTYLAESVTAEELNASISTLARAGDKMERMLIGDDLA
ncbi:MAG: YbjN domain-containing protein [Candidatus Eremiobacteraeota bacterium]|nr:YbjN domain-containing protein [Candidatus Eremiobacteraeota bacterium]